MTTFMCPDCGRVFHIVPEGGKMKRGGWKRQEWQEFGFTAGPGVLVQPGATLERQTPTRGQTKESDVVVPFLKSAVYGGVGACLSFMAATGGVLKWDWAWYVPPTVAGVAGLLSFSVAWWLLDKATMETLWQVETWAGMDLDKDGHVGKPEPVEEWVRSEILDRDRKQALRVQFKFSHDALSKVAVAVLHEGESFSRRALSQYVSETQFRYLQQEMLDRGLCRWKDPEHENLGVEITPGGKAFLRGYLPK